MINNNFLNDVLKRKREEVSSKNVEQDSKF